MDKKIQMLQSEVAMLSLTVASLQLQVNQLHESISSNTLTKEELQNAPSTLSIDDNSDSEEEEETVFAPRIKSRVRLKNTNQYVLVCGNGHESGYEDSDNESASDNESMRLTLDPVRLNPFEADTILKNIIAESDVLEEL